MKTDPDYYPDAQMCCVCAHALADCSSLDFKSMYVLKVDKSDNTKTVRCTNFQRENRIVTFVKAKVKNAQHSFANGLSSDL